MRRINVLLSLFMVVSPVLAQELPRYCLENDSVNHYLNDFSYDTIPDYNVSYILQYYNKDASFRSDWPKPVPLSWTNDPAATSQYIEVSDDAAFATIEQTFNVGTDASEYDLYNLIPGKTYYYRVMAVNGGEAIALKTGTFQTTGFLRMLRADGTLNVRDMGGWKGLHGHTIRYGLLFRGARLKEDGSTNAIVSQQGITYLRDAGIRAELDLRSKSNVPSGESALAVDGDVDFLLVPESVNARMLNYDKNDANIRELQWIINELKAGKPVYYHCSMGADRTGTLGFLIGALLGMSDGDLAKDYEITTFCSYYTGENGYATPFARLRNYTGKMGSPDNNQNTKKEYMFAPLIEEKLVTVEPINGTTQQKIYNFFKNGVSGTKISTADLDWFIYHMLGVTFTINKSSVELKPRETFQIETQASLYNNPNPEVKYTSSDPSVATVSADGIITAARGGNATITVEMGGFKKSVSVTVPLVESVLADTLEYDGYLYRVKSVKTKNGSFEYANTFLNWTGADDKVLASESFEIKSYGTGDSLYIESKLDGDETSPGSLKMEWAVVRNRTYVLGFRIKNSTDLVSDSNANIKAYIAKKGDDSKLEVLSAPSYDGNWTEVRYVFTCPVGFDRCRLLFTHLSQNGNNTCFDNFYFAEVTNIGTSVSPVRVNESSTGKYYNLSGIETTGLGSGIIIKDGKKYLNR